MFGSTDCSIEFSFCRTCGSQRLGFAFVGNGANGEEEGKTRCRAALEKTICMSSIKEASEMGARSKRWKGRQSRVHRENFKGARWQCWVRNRAMVVDAQGLGPTKILGNFLIWKWISAGLQANLLSVMTA